MEEQDKEECFYLREVWCQVSQKKRRETPGSSENHLEWKVGPVSLEVRYQTVKKKKKVMSQQVKIKSRARQSSLRH